MSDTDKPTVPDTQPAPAAGTVPPPPPPGMPAPHLPAIQPIRIELPTISAQPKTSEENVQRPAAGPAPLPVTPPSTVTETTPVPGPGVSNPPAAEAASEPVKPAAPLPVSEPPKAEIPPVSPAKIPQPETTPAVVPPVVVSEPDTHVVTPAVPGDTGGKKPHHPHGGGKGSPLRFVAFAGLFLVVLMLPILIYYTSQNKQITEMRKKAAGTGGSCDIKSGMESNLSCRNTCPGAAEGPCKINATCCSWNPNGGGVYPTNPPAGSQQGCIGGSWITVGSCKICSMGGTVTCDGPGSGGGDPCRKVVDGKVISVPCGDVGMIRCNCNTAEKPIWVGGAAGVSCNTLCSCANIKCDSCTTPSPGTHTEDSPTPTKTPTKTPTSTSTHTPTSTSTPTSTNTSTPTGTSTNTPTGTQVTSTPTNTPTNTNTPTSTNTSTPTSTNTPTPTIPSECGSSCTSNNQCTTGLVCDNSKCVLPECLQENVVCDSTRCRVLPTPTPTRTYYSPTPTRELAFVETPTPTPRTPKVPISGGPTILGVGTVVGGLLLLLLGLAL